MGACGIGPEFVAKEIQEWLARACVRTLSIQKASPWENGYVESFNGRLREELLDRELFLSLPEARVVLDQWRMDYTHRRPHGGLEWLTPAAFVAGLDDTASGVVPAASRGVSPVGATAPPSDTPRGLFPNSLMSTGTKTGEGSVQPNAAGPTCHRVSGPTWTSRSDSGSPAASSKPCVPAA
jgi:putative transposase